MVNLGGRTDTGSKAKENRVLLVAFVGRRRQGVGSWFESHFFFNVNLKMRSPQTFQRLGSSLIILGLLISFKTCDCATPGPAPKPANITTVCAAKGVNTPFVSCQPDGKADDFTGILTTFVPFSTHLI